MQLFRSPYWLSRPFVFARNFSPLLGALTVMGCHDSDHWSSFLFLDLYQTVMADVYMKAAEPMYSARPALKAIYPTGRKNLLKYASFLATRPSFDLEANADTSIVRLAEILGGSEDARRVVLEAYKRAGGTSVANAESLIKAAITPFPYDPPELRRPGVKQVHFLPYGDGDDDAPPAKKVAALENAEHNTSPQDQWSRHIYTASRPKRSVPRPDKYPA